MPCAAQLASMQSDDAQGAAEYCCRNVKERGLASSLCEVRNSNVVGCNTASEHSVRVACISSIRVHGDWGF